ncbi:hypothetical protein F5I97DRAFT_814514 [Phlebopus sp. FC_14]|nr:hypothetical protein F5I97DRAFT_814514 [Phlebopus sp. FC_14]
MHRCMCISFKLGCWIFVIAFIPRTGFGYGKVTRRSLDRQMNKKGMRKRKANKRMRRTTMTKRRMNKGIEVTTVFSATCSAGSMPEWKPGG